MILDEIVAQKKQDIAALKPLTDLPVSQRDFTQAFTHDQIGIIAELKSRSPSAGVIKAAYDPIALAKAYTQGGADAISVLTDQPFFGGSLAHLSQVREVTDLPLLCKDFIIDPRQVQHARQAGADACLLIVAILEDPELLALKKAIEALGMTALIEIHNAEELTRALAVDPQCIAINNRDLRNFSMDTANAERLCQQIPASIHVISASGLTDPASLKHFPKRLNGVLVGTALMQSANPEDFLRQCRSR